MKLDDWQREVLEYDGNIALRSSRQVGKSTVIALKAAQYVVSHPNKTVLIIAAVERQAYLLFDKCLGFIIDKFPDDVWRFGPQRPTRHLLQMKNGSKVWCLPAGLSGNNIRGLTCDLIIIDEAAYCPEDIYQAITPMLATTKGKLILLSTPKNREGYFYTSFQDPNFKTWHIPYTMCPRLDEQFIERERARMTRKQFACEYEGEFVSDLNQFFPDQLIKKCMVLQRDNSFTSLSDVAIPSADIYAGVDIASFGRDQTVLFSAQRIRRDGKISKIRQVSMQITEKTYLVETVRMIKDANSKYNYKKIGVDDAGIGLSVYQELLLSEETRRKVEALNNASRFLDHLGEKKKSLAKEDMYNNLLWLMEAGKLELFDDPEIYLSLRSIQSEYDEKGKLRIWGNYSHIAEAIIRCCWSATADKSLNIWIA